MLKCVAPPTFLHRFRSEKIKFDKDGAITAKMLPDLRHLTTCAVPHGAAGPAEITVPRWHEEDGDVTQNSVEILVRYGRCL